MTLLFAFRLNRTTQIPLTTYLICLLLFAYQPVSFSLNGLLSSDELESDVVDRGRKCEAADRVIKGTQSMQTRLAPTLYIHKLCIPCHSLRFDVSLAS